jgi:DMSO/TMAO reductase YedYZ heme-binding membrane subunit
MKTYLHSIQFLQKFFLSISILIMLSLPLVLVFVPEMLSEDSILALYDISHIAMFLVMFIRPLADLLKGVTFIRPLVILRKGVGVFSASIVVSFIFAKIIMDPAGYFSAFGTPEYWSLERYALLGHLADISAIILLITSNNLSKRILGNAWKKIQKLSYVFFYASSFYVFLSYGNMSVLYSIVIITIITLLAYLKNKQPTVPIVSLTKAQPFIQ